MRRRGTAALLVFASLVVAGCAGERSRTSTPATSASTEPPAEVSITTASSAPALPATPAVLAVRLDHYAIEPNAIQAVAGRVTLTATNVDDVPHDVTLIRTARAASDLPTTGIRVDETSPDIEILGRTPRLAAEETGSFTTSLSAGTYILVCTVPHHYVREAMLAALTIT